MPTESELNNLKIKKIKDELKNKWDNQKSTGFERLAKAYQFFVAFDDCGQMVFSDYCAYTEDMRLGNDGKSDFERFVLRRLDLTSLYHSYHEPFATALKKKVEKIADDYFDEQSHRLASYIVKIHPKEIDN